MHGSDQIGRERGVLCHAAGEPAQRRKTLSEGKQLMLEETCALLARPCTHVRAMQSGGGCKSCEPVVDKKYPDGSRIADVGWC